MSLLTLNDVVVRYPMTVKRKFFSFFETSQYITVIKKISFSIKEGEILGLVGESGCGKTTLMHAILGQIPLASGSIFWKDQPILNSSKKERAKNIQFIFQNALAAMNPKMNVYEIISEPLRLILEKPPAESVMKRQVLEMLQWVGLPSSFINAYPRQFSGGEAQRVAIARALISRPKLLICDEPVSALDVSIQAKIINLLIDLNKRFNLSIIFISHNLLVVRQIADNILVMYSGLKMEFGSTEELLCHPRHPYTSGLWAAVPLINVQTMANASKFLAKDEETLQQSPSHSGCAFYARCPYAKNICLSNQPLAVALSSQHWCACIRAQQLKDQLWRPNFSSKVPL